MRVLYVDDDRLNALLFEEICRIVGGTEVEVAVNGEDALGLARQFGPDLLVIDLHLPDITGQALLPLLRELLARPELPAILCTADDDPRVAAAAQLAGFSARWIKPVDVSVVRQALEQHAGRLGAGR